MISANKSRLNQRQWLNIIIIAISAAFLLFVLIGKMLNQSIEKQQKTVEENQQQQLELLQIDFGDWQLIKENNQWQSLRKKLSKNDIQQIAKKWQDLLNQSGTQIDLSTKPEKIHIEKTILLYIDNSKQPIICKLRKLNENAEIVFFTLNIKFLLSSDDINLYYPNLYHPE